MCDGDASEVERRLAEHFLWSGWGAPGPSERRSWRGSLPVLSADLRDAGLDAVEVIPEHRLPLSSKRADVVLAGVHPRTGLPSYVVVELKQWGTAAPFEGSDTLVDVVGAPYRPVLHPAAQVSGYASYLTDFVRALDGRTDAVVGVAYLHNATEYGVAGLRGMAAAAEARLFTGERRSEFHDFLRSRLAPTSGAEAADLFLASAIAPSKQLLSLAAKEIQEREQFVLLDEQRVAYELVLAAVEKARRADRKVVVVIAGGPGSGKSVIALSLLGELARQGHTVLHATGSKSFTSTLRQVAGKGSSQVKSLFKYFNSFMTAEKNGLEVLILDEAHRLREKSVNRYTRKELRETARPQIEELIDAARVPVFLLDQHQVVRPGEMGSVAEIESHARARGLDLHHVDLSAQYRAGGSEAYLAWVLQLLGLEGDGPVPWSDEPHFAVEVVDTPRALEERLGSVLAQGYGARMTAGYCWRWSDPRPDGTLVRDVSIGAWSRPWNLKSERSVGGAPPSQLWATDPAGFGQVGCVYTAQGFEYDWNGVILGDDLVWRTDRWVSQREFNKDPDFRNRKAVDDATFDRLVRHVYKVLLTRGMVGTVLYSTDRETREMLGELVNPAR
ncbi:DUF2075 domain-containing protein [Cellulomonas carbonis]|uniref:DUF2075 domain-containing protein n=1 Tax=Cellulomonas carbonis TaxID=1386092 RepID=UPI001E5F35C4|nr:DUF2075 domain-containing protein [Cellulomonas carbonis]